MSSTFLAGVIEGFYGPPWTAAERGVLFGRMAAWGLNTYLYAPKDDLKQRWLWREAYSEAEASELGRLIQTCQGHGVRWVHALSPGLDMRYAESSEWDTLWGRIEQLRALGCRDFCLLFDDIPEQLDAASQARWGSLAAAQAGVVNLMFERLRQRLPEARLLFCPTAYCGRMARAGLGGAGYLEAVGRGLPAEVDVLWTGPEIVSCEITVAHAVEMASVLRRQPVIWDNLHANDYDGRRFFCGPYAGRPLELRAHVRGLLSNPNTEFDLNFVPLHALACFLRQTVDWDARAAYLRALEAWQSEFAIAGEPVEVGVDDLALLFDCYYLPHAEGPSAEALLGDLQALLAMDPEVWGDRVGSVRQRLVRLRDFCARLAGLRQRSLFHALGRRVWELREELDLLDRYLAARSEPARLAAPFRSDFHLPLTYRGGLVVRLQRLLAALDDGTFVVGPATARATPAAGAAAAAGVSG